MLEERASPRSAGARDVLHSVRTKILAVVAVSLVSIAGVEIGTYASFSRQIETSERVRHTRDVISAARLLETRLLAAQTDLHGYALSGRAEDLRGVRDSLELVGTHHQDLARLVRDNPSQVARLEALRVAVAVWPLATAKIGDAMERGEPAVARGVVSETRQAMSGLRTLLDEFRQVEERALAEGIRARDAATRRTRFFLVFGAAFAVAGGIGAALFLGSRVIRPLEALTGAVEKVAGGDLAQRVTVDGDDEVGRLGTAFNAMVARVEQRQQALDRSRSEALTLLSIARVIGGTEELQEALRLICRELARLTGAETVSAYVVDRERGELAPIAGYHVPGHALAMLSTATLPLAEQGFRDAAIGLGRVVWSDDVQNDPRFASPLFRAFPHRSGVIVPVIRDAAVAGAFYLVWWREQRHFAEVELAMLHTVGRQVGLLLRTASLLDQIRHERSQLEALNEVSRRLAAVHDMDEILSLIVAEASRLVSADAATLRMREGDEWVLRGRTQGAAELTAHPRVSAAESLVGLVLERDGPVVIDDLAADPVHDPRYTRRVRELGFRSLVASPLRAHGRITGTLIVYRKTPRRFTAGEVSLLSAFADQAALGLEKDRLLREAEGRRRQAGVLADLARDIGASLDVGAVLQRVADGARELCGAEAARIALREAGTDTMTFRYWAGTLYPGYRTLVIEPGKGIGGRVLETGDPLRTADYANDPRFSKDYLDAARADRIVAMVGVPIRIKDWVEGVIFVDRRGPPPFTEGDEAILVQLAEHAAIAIGNARLYEMAESRRREAEAIAEALRASEEQFRQIVEGSIQGVYIHQDLIARFVNPAMARIFGFASPEEMVGLHFLTLVAPHEQPRLRRNFEARMRGEPVPSRYEFEARRKDGSALWIEILVTRVSWQGAPAVMGTFLDITERKRAGDALRRSEEEKARLFEEAENRRTQLEQIFASTSDGMLVLDLGGRVTALNRRGGELLGIPPGEVVDRPFARLVGLLEGTGVWADPGGAALLRAVEKGAQAGAGDLELQFPRPATLHWQVAPTRDVLGVSVGLTVTLQDVTHEREVSRMKSDFVSFVTHQLRTPLAGIKWMLELAAQGPETGEETRSYVVDAREAAQRLINLVNDLLDVSRLESGKLSMVLRETSLADTTRGVLEEIAPLLRERGHRVSVEEADALPPVVVDPQLLRQVILNLVSNAAKYTPPGGAIAIRIGYDARAVEWAIRDSGIGIPREAQRRLFEKFYRADNALAIETEGTGLGLYIVRLVVERFGGRIGCESEEGKGSTFTLTLPRKGAGR